MNAWPYVAFARAAFLKTLAYRLRYFTGVASYVVYVTTYYFLWRAFYNSRESSGEVAEFDLEAMVTYVAVGWLARSFYFSNIDRIIADHVREGEIALALARPVSFQGMMMAEAFGASLFRLLFFTPPVAVALLILYPIQAPASLPAFFAFLISCFLAHLVFAAVNFLIGLLALHLKFIDGVMRAKHYLLELLSGLVMPVSFFPEWMQVASKFLPFASIAYLPGTIYLGKRSGSEVVWALLNQLLWVVILLSLGQWLWRRAARRLTVQGG